MQTTTVSLGISSCGEETDHRQWVQSGSGRESTNADRLRRLTLRLPRTHSISMTRMNEVYQTGAPDPESQPTKPVWPRCTQTRAPSDYLVHHFV